MTISDFARSRGVEPQAVSRYLTRHPEVKKHTVEHGKSVELLPEAVALLDPVYPPPRPVEVIKGVPHEDHEKALRKIVALQEKLLALQVDLANEKSARLQAEAGRLALEDKSALKDEQIAELKAKNRTKSKAIESLDEKLNQAQDVIDRLYARSLWDRIRNKSV